MSFVYKLYNLKISAFNKRHFNCSVFVITFYYYAKVRCKLSEVKFYIHDLLCMLHELGK